MERKVAIFPGTFDPVTLGHLDVIQDSSKIFDEVIVGLLVNPAKKPKFTDEERKEMLEEAVADLGLANVRVKIFKGLAVKLARQEKAMVMIRSLRLTMEYEDELKIIFNNRILDPDIIPILIPPRQEHIHISSSAVRELLNFGQVNLDKYVPQAVLEHIGILEERYKERVLEVCRRLAGHNELAVIIGDTIIEHYREQHRAYHVLKHINDSLDELERIRHLLQNPDAVEMEILCHDAIYDVRAKDNEEKSAEFARDLVMILGLGSSFGERVAELIMATKHKIPPADFDAQIAADIDLASLGYSEREFDKNTEKIRREYTECGYLTSEQFGKGRAAFLKSFLPPERPAIYLTQFFRERYETKARQNLKRSIEQLSI